MLWNITWNPLKRGLVSHSIHYSGSLISGILKFLDCICLLCSVCVGNSLSDFSSSAAARLTLVIMGRTPHRGRPSQCCFYGCTVTVVLRLILSCTNRLHHQFDCKTNTERCSLNTSEHIIRIFGVPFPSELFQSQVLCLHSHSNYSLYISSSHILMSSSIIFWFQIKKRRKRDEAASQQDLPSTNLMVGNSDVCLFFLLIVDPFINDSLIILDPATSVSVLAFTVINLFSLFSVFFGVG